MSQNNFLQGYNWENQFEDSQILSRSIPDEVISIYEVYVKEECAAQDGSSQVSVTSGDSSETNQPNVQAGVISLNAIDIDAVNIDGNNMKLFEKNIDLPILTPKKVPDIIINQQNDTVSQSLTNDPILTSTPRLIDKDDPRSRLHFVKYLKRDGKTLKIWECGICSKEFRHQYTLMRHLPTHTDERNFKCDVCGKAFRQLSTLSQHKAIHSDARPYVCEFCKKTFNRVSTLISHRKTHSENKPHKCHLCGKGFHQKGNLRNHVFTHTNERPYKCELCNKGFNQMSNLVCHKVKAHAHVEKMQYSCGICGKEFPRRFSLRSHEEFKHGIKYRNSSSSQASMSNSPINNDKNIKIIESNSNKNIDDNKDVNSCMTSILIDKIETKAMESAIMNGQTPFALLKPAKGIPVLVKVTPAGPNQHMLIPASAEDLRVTGKMSPFNSETENRTVQVKVSVVATIVQNINSDGKSSYLIEPPISDQDQENLLTPLENSQFYNMDSLGESEHPSEPSHNSSMDDCNELLELAAQGGIQFVRATEDGRYEVMSNSEARDLIAQNSHDVTILEGAEADAINIMNAKNNINDNVIVTDNDNQIMILESGNQKPVSTEGIEIPGDKDIRILDAKNLDDRFVDNMTFFSSSKMDDILGGIKPIGLDSGIPIVTPEEDIIGPHQNFLNIMDHQNDMGSLSNNSQSSILPLLTKNESSLSFLNETLSYLKSTRSFIDDFNILGVDGICMEDSNSVNVYDPKIKLPEFDDIISDSSFLPMNRVDGKVLNDKGQTSKLYANNESKLTLPSFEDMKILGPKYQEFEAASQFHDIKIFGGYDQYLRPVNGYRSGDSLMYEPPPGKIDFKMMGKKNEPQCFDELREDVLVKVPSLFKLNPSTSSTPITIPDFLEADAPRHMDKNGTDNFFFQANNFCDPDYLNFPSQNSESPNSQTASMFTLDGLPDLN
ncbi:uncharacterized protein [Chelonus insularis]|uniref:uncharacterized protein n=1 Tax=Chelonus insularis TaxID=460826 RepID=UPI001588B32B|nr:uncharacterized protein LOC118074426 [Chelonus insularis]